MKPLRILQASVALLYQPNLYTQGLRELGHKADFMSFYTKGVEAFMLDKPDFDQHSNDPASLARMKTREAEFLLRALDEYDIFHFHSNYTLLWPNSTLWNTAADLAFLRKLGKKVVMSFWGWCDVCRYDMPRPGGIENTECSVCTSLKPFCCENAKRIQQMEWSFAHSNALLSNSNVAAAFPEIIWMDNAINCDVWRHLSAQEIPGRFRLPPTENLRIYHSFARSDERDDVKGTGFIRAAVERLQAEGYPVEFIYFDRVPNADVKYYMAQADLAVDQLFCGWHGCAGVECLAMGKPVIVYINPATAKIIPQKHPLIYADRYNIYDVLKEYIQDRGRLKKIGEASREYAVKYHHYMVVAKRLEGIYRSIIDEE